MSSEHKAWAAAFTGTVVDVQRWTERSVTSQPQLEKQAARIEERNREWAKNAGTRNYAKYCGAPGERKGKLQFSASGNPVCQLRVPDLGMQLKTTPVRMSGGGWVCQCPSAQETEQYYYESLTANARELLSGL